MTRGLLRATIIVPTYRRIDLLRRCLDALDSQRLPSHDYEIVIADDAASKDTEQSVSDWNEGRKGVQKCDVLYLPVTSTQGPAAARNAGARVARGQILAFTDDDCVPSTEWLASGITAFETDPSLDAAWGRLEMPIPTLPTDYERDASGLAKAVFVTANCFVRRSVFEKVGGFDERFQAAWREDSDLYFTLLEKGARIRHVREALVVHPVRPARWGVSLWQQRKSSYDVLLRLKHPALYRQRIPAFPKLYPAIAIAGQTCAIAFIAGHYPVAITSAAIWQSLSLYFAWLRLRGTSHRLTHIGEMVATSMLIPWFAIYYRLVGLQRFCRSSFSDSRKS